MMVRKYLCNILHSLVNNKPIVAQTNTDLLFSLNRKLSADFGSPCQ